MTKKEKMIGGVKKAALLLSAPLAVMLLILLNFWNNDMFPFGDGTISWCDMSQQVIPLLSDFKDILSGKAGVFLNLQNAGGMNLWGVIFFFIASPFTLLVAFVPKTQIIYFVNILLILKLMTAAFTSMVYFRTCQKKLSPVYAFMISVAYAFCGYGMLFYQNIIWLDMMYLFPLLIVSFNYMIERKRILPYVAVLTAMMVVNYYISYMVVLYILLFMALFCFRYRNEEKYQQLPARFFTGSLLSALISAVVWLPSFMQYLSSGRTSSVIDNLTSGGFFDHYQTTVSLLFCSAFLLSVTLICTVDGKRRSKKLNTYLIMFFLLLVPVFIEPVNIMWHTGSYMSFPVRYGFMTIFVAGICTGMYLSDNENRPPQQLRKKANIFVTLVCTAVAAGYCIFASDFVQNNFDGLTAYTRTLWQNNQSFIYLMEMFAVAAVVFGTFFLLYKKGLLSKSIFALLCCAVLVTECYSNLDIYVSSADKNYTARAKDQQQVMDLSDKIEDKDGFYRVKTSSKLFDINLVGAMGYNSISHYTSLTSRDYMYMMKNLGYSSYWMEVGSYGGTEITDALLSMKYKIGMAVGSPDSIYSNGDYQIDKLDNYIPLGLVTNSDLTGCEELPDTTRADIQEYLYDKLLKTDSDSDIIKHYKYNLSNGIIALSDKPPYSYELLNDNGTITYDIRVDGRQSVYFDCFDKLSNNLKEPINDTFTVKVNGITLQNLYPSQANNGLLKIGTFENCNLKIEIDVNKNFSCKSFGLFGVDLDKLEQSVNNAKSANLTADGGKLSGTYNAVNGEKCVLSIPYQDSLKIKINGKNVKFEKAFGDMTAFELHEGKNEITVTNVPKGFYAGAIISAIGIILAVMYKIFGRKIKYGEILCTALRIIIIGAGAMLILGIYILPCLINLFCE